MRRWKLEMRSTEIKITAQVDSRPSRAPITSGAVTKVVRTVHCAALSQETPLPHSGLGGPFRRHPRRSCARWKYKRRMRQSTLAPSSLRNRPAIFCWTCKHPDSALGLVVIEWDPGVRRKARTWDRCLSRRSIRFLGLDFFCGPRFFARADGARGFWRWASAMMAS